MTVRSGVTERKRMRFSCTAVVTPRELHQHRRHRETSRTMERMVQGVSVGIFAYAVGIEAASARWNAACVGDESRGSETNTVR